MKNDRLMATCEDCGKGMYIEMSISDSLKSIVTCDKCKAIKHRFRSTDKNINIINISTALKKVVTGTEGKWSTAGNGMLGREHILDMLEQMESGKVFGEKAHRWLGWAQAAIVGAGIGDLDLMKKINLGL